MERVAEMLRKGGYRATPQRLAVYRALLAGRTILALR